MAYWIGNVLLTVSCTSPFKIFRCLQHHYFSRFTTHLGRCRLLLSNHAIQQISRSSAWYLTNRKPSLPHPPTPPSKVICNCEKMRQNFTPKTIKILHHVPLLVLLTWQHIAYSKNQHFLNFLAYGTTSILVLLTLFHQCIGGNSDSCSNILVETC